MEFTEKRTIGAFNDDEYFIKSSSDNVYLNLDKIKKLIKSKVIQNLIIAKYSKEHFRIYNLLNFHLSTLHQ